LTAIGVRVLAFYVGYRATTCFGEMNAIGLGRMKTKEFTYRATDVYGNLRRSIGIFKLILFRCSELTKLILICQWDKKVAYFNSIVVRVQWAYSPYLEAQDYISFIKLYYSTILKHIVATCSLFLHEVHDVNALWRALHIWLHVVSPELLSLY